MAGEERSTPKPFQVAIAYITYQIISHLWHPLYRFPGPFLASFSSIPHCSSFLGGRQPFDRLALHEKYGPVVRTSPNELSFSTSQSWKDIYGSRPGHQLFRKAPFYEGASFDGKTLSIISETDPVSHKKMRAQLNTAFSDKSLRDQENLIAEPIDLFIDQIGEKGDCPEGIDIVMWFNLMTFDIIGSLAFGESFGGLESAKFHEWIQLAVGSMKQGALADSLGRYPKIAAIIKKLFPAMIDKILQDTRKHEAHTMDLVKRRLAKDSDRPDFSTRIIEDREANGISATQIAAHSSDFIIAGSETTATTLSCATYHLLRDPELYDKLRKEIRGAFSSYEQIDSVSASKIKLVNAVCLEAMRMYPPLPFALPRVVPQGGDTVDGHMIPEGITVSTNPFAASMSSINFKDPFKFSPDRWLGNNELDDLDATQPFSYGPRACMGRSLGWAELYLAMCKLHYKYDLELVNTELDWFRDSKMHIVWHKPAMMVRVKPRSS
ncbi:putative P450 monooxygenase [Aureobasidium sp. EXF-10728]|nr:putative P450 monooxygenase [Aureobasidium sp. EXF-10728]